MIRLSLFLFMFVLFIPASVHAGHGGEREFQEAEKFYQEHKAEIELCDPCEETRPAAQEALDLYAIAVEEGNPNAQFKMGWMYLSKKGVAYDLEKGLELWQDAAKNGHIDALINIASFTYEGQLLPQDFEKAHDLYEQAAKKGHGLGQYYIALNYLDGKGTTQDFIESYAWVSAAIETLKFDDVKQQAVLLRDELVKDHLSESDKKRADIIAIKYQRLYVNPFLGGK